MAIANRIARAIYFIIKNSDERYQDLGADRVDPKQKQMQRLVKKLEVLGYKVELRELTA